ncbi:MAG: preprotein translocase subunit SecE [Treponema sp.]|uniref:preprotein translocase subunit SecE n=1 Tax=Treponema sp. TaxID=166 RepID=UPI001B651B5F|nr:preprotein translocase subunit SecE [Treponema sp.]MBP5402657.1 preprotein translocase subunit SecE [Treponema sp.]MBR5933763.1 preprotein translocase subunit SecE [Treponema sp.]
MAKKANEVRKSNFFKECVGELKKVTWPTRDDVWASVKVVVVLTIITSVILGAFDSGFTALYSLLMK